MGECTPWACIEIALKWKWCSIKQIIFTYEHWKSFDCTRFDPKKSTFQFQSPESIWLNFQFLTQFFSFSMQMFPETAHDSNTVSDCEIQFACETLFTLLTRTIWITNPCIFSLLLFVSSKSTLIIWPLVYPPTGIVAFIKSGSEAQQANTKNELKRFICSSTIGCYRLNGDKKFQNFHVFSFSLNSPIFQTHAQCCVEIKSKWFNYTKRFSKFLIG